MDRRKFIKSAAATGAALLGPGLSTLLGQAQTREAATQNSTYLPLVRQAQTHLAATPPNILIIIVDQLRDPQWYPDQATLDRALPAMARLRSGAVNFRQHYVAATASTPSRAALATGLYAHQTGCLLTISYPGRPDLVPDFPTWGTMLRGVGYETYWWGKWHLSTTCDLEQYGFSGGTCPSPNGYPGEGLTQDPATVDQYLTWLRQQGTNVPWATTVSLINPHDIGWHYQGTQQRAYAEVEPFFTALPPNFERRTDLVGRNKPRLQIAMRDTINNFLGGFPDEGSNYEVAWLRYMNLYLHIQQQLDKEIGRVLDALAASPFAANTIVMLTSDHGDYCGSHGLRGKAFGGYDEALRVPFMVKDPTGRFTTRPDVERTQFTSHVDVAPLLLTLATGGNDWRSQPSYAHLANRLDIAAILANPAAAGRPYILHTSDEDLWEALTLPPGFNDMPMHLVTYRTPNAKLGMYTAWRPGTIDIEPAGRELECYDFSTTSGRMELDNVVQTNSTLTNQLMSGLLNDAMPNELREPLPQYLRQAQQQGFNTYFAARTIVVSDLTPTSILTLFPYRPLNTGSTAEKIVFTNESTKTVTIRSISIIGADAQDFVQTNDAGASISPGGQFTVALTFVPTAVGARNASLVVTHSGTGTTGVTLVGVGSQNLLSNPGFELNADGNSAPDGWTTNSRVTRSRSLVRNGQYAMRHSATNNSTYEISQKIQGLTADTTYAVTAWVNIPTANQGLAFNIIVRWFASNNSLLATNVVRSFTKATTGWEQAAASLVAPSQSTYAYLTMTANNLNTTLYVDDCSWEIENMIINGSFEWDSDQDGTPDNWSGNTFASLSGSVVRKGRYALKHAATVQADYGIYQAVRSVIARVGYDVFAWVNIPASNKPFSFQVEVQWRTSADVVLATTVVKTYTSATLGWDLAYTRCIAPAGTGYAMVVMTLKGINPGIYVDDVAMRP